MTTSGAPRKRATALLAALGVAVAVSGCGTTQPPKLDAAALAEAQTFPYFRIYWTGPTFDGHPLTAVDGREGYNSAIGDSVYYGDCTPVKKVLGGGGNCGLPLKVTTVVYRLHSNAPLGPQRNVVIRGVPATIYDKGRSIELYSGRLAIDIYSNEAASALLAAQQLQAVNAAPRDRPRAGHAGGSAVTDEAGAPLPLPVYCPGMSGELETAVLNLLLSLPGEPCQRAQAALSATGRTTAPL